MFEIYSTDKRSVWLSELVLSGRPSPLLVSNLTWSISVHIEYFVHIVKQNQKFQHFVANIPIAPTFAVSCLQPDVGIFASVLFYLFQSLLRKPEGLCSKLFYVSDINHWRWVYMHDNFIDWIPLHQWKCWVLFVLKCRINLCKSNYSMFSSLLGVVVTYAFSHLHRLSGPDSICCDR